MLKIALLLVKNVFFGLKNGINELVSQIAAKLTALDYNSGSVENASDILVPAANVHSSSSGSPFFSCSAHSKKTSATWMWESTDKLSEKVQCELTVNILLHFSSDPCL